jgi:nitrogenase-stabilizing/protective protein
MGTLHEFVKLNVAEEFFQFFALRYEQRVLDQHRAQVLKRFSLELEEAWRRAPEPTEDEWLWLCREALRRAYALYAEAALPRPLLAAM